ncbi:MAG: hypothetical protein COA80_08510 [Leeuwenhoekiella sp.]|nr:MAG: hypothetical protein COA80_08510 [Leeuwenhoekiella sp.]
MRPDYENAYAEYRIKTGILFLYYKSLTCLTLNAAEKVVHDRLAFQTGKAYPVYCDVRKIIDSEKEARDYLIGQGNALILAIAFRVTHPVSESITQFYLKKNKPKIPTQLVVDIRTGISFLKDYCAP